jgi:hypothetical protein
MKWTYKTNTRGVALVDGQNFKKGDTIPVQVYELYIDSRGNPKGSTTKVFYYGLPPMPEEAPAPPPSMRPPNSQKLTFEKDFGIAKETSTGVSSTPSQSGGTIEELSNNKTVMWLGLIVVGYFAYKYINKK